jgi:hypothetical protein
MKNLIYLFFLTQIAHTQVLINKKPTDIVDFKSPNSYLLDSMVFNEIQKYRVNKKMMTFNYNSGASEVCQINNYMKMNNLDPSLDYSFGLSYALIDTFIQGKFNLLLDFAVGSNPKGRNFKNRIPNWNIDGWNGFATKTFYYGRRQYRDTVIVCPKIDKREFIQLVDSKFNCFPCFNEKLHYNYLEYNIKQPIDLFRIEEVIIKVNSDKQLTYNQLIGQILLELKNNSKTEFIFNSSLVDYYCTEESECNQFGIAVDFYGEYIVITIANFNLY